jgi:pimeloyl-ACP methyl ester carboxylesterase
MRSGPWPRREQPWFELSFVPPQLPERIETTKWYREFDFDPAASIGQVHAPVLLVLAERDPWIPTGETELVWSTHCPCELTVVRIPNSNHFMAATTDPTHDLDAEPVAPEYMQRLVTWLKEQGEVVESE